MEYDVKFIAADWDQSFNKINEELFQKVDDIFNLIKVLKKHACLKAVKFGNINIVKLLLDNKKIIKDKKSIFGNKTEIKPLDEAIKNDKKEIIQLLSQ